MGPNESIKRGQIKLTNTYVHLELPGLTEAIEKRDWKEARRQQEILENALARNTDLLQSVIEVRSLKRVEDLRDPVPNPISRVGVIRIIGACRDG